MQNQGGGHELKHFCLTLILTFPSLNVFLFSFVSLILSHKAVLTQIHMLTASLKHTEVLLNAVQQLVTGLSSTQADLHMKYVRSGADRLAVSQRDKEKALVVCAKLKLCERRQGKPTEGNYWKHISLFA